MKLLFPQLESLMFNLGGTILISHQNRLSDFLFELFVGSL